MTMTVAGVKCPSAYVYLEHNSKTNNPKVFNLFIGNDLGILYMVLGQKVEVTGSKSTKIYCRRSCGQRKFAPLSSRVPTV